VATNKIGYLRISVFYRARGTLLQCFAAKFYCTLTWVFRKTNSCLSSATIHSSLIVRNYKLIKRMKILLRGFKQHQIIRKVQTNDLAISNSDTIVDPALAVCPIDILLLYKEEWR